MLLNFVVRNSLISAYNDGYRVFSLRASEYSPWVMNFYRRFFTAHDEFPAELALQVIRMVASYRYAHFSPEKKEEVLTSKISKLVNGGK